MEVIVSASKLNSASRSLILLVTGLNAGPGKCFFTRGLIFDYFLVIKLWCTDAATFDVVYT